MEPVSFTLFVILPNEDVCSLRNLASGTTIRAVRRKLELWAGLPAQTYRLTCWQGRALHEDHVLRLDANCWDGFVLRAVFLAAWHELHALVLAGREEDVIQHGAVRIRDGVTWADEAEAARAGEVMRERGVVALFLASFLGMVDMCRALLSAGVDPNGRTLFGRTPLFAAMARDHDHVMELLLAHQGSLEARDAEGVNPVDVGRRLAAKQCMRKVRHLQLQKRGESMTARAATLNGGGRGERGRRGGPGVLRIPSEADPALPSVAPPPFGSSHSDRPGTSTASRLTQGGGRNLEKRGVALSSHSADELASPRPVTAKHSAGDIISNNATITDTLNASNHSGGSRAAKPVPATQPKLSRHHSPSSSSTTNSTPTTMMVRPPRQPSRSPDRPRQEGGERGVCFTWDNHLPHPNSRSPSAAATGPQYQARTRTPAAPATSRSGRPGTRLLRAGVGGSLEAAVSSSSWSDMTSASWNSQASPRLLPFRPSVCDLSLPSKGPQSVLTTTTRAISPGGSASGRGGGDEWVPGLVESTADREGGGGRGDEVRDDMEEREVSRERGREAGKRGRRKPSPALARFCSPFASGPQGGRRHQDHAPQSRDSTGHAPHPPDTPGPRPPSGRQDSNPVPPPALPPPPPTASSSSLARRRDEDAAEMAGSAGQGSCQGSVLGSQEALSVGSAPDPITSSEQGAELAAADQGGSDDDGGRVMTPRVKSSRSSGKFRNRLLVSHQRQQESWRTMKRRIRLAEEQKRHGGTATTTTTTTTTTTKAKHKGNRPDAKDSHPTENFEQWLDRKRKERQRNQRSSDEDTSEDDTDDVMNRSAENSQAFSDWLKELKDRSLQRPHTSSPACLHRRKTRPLKDLIQVGGGEESAVPQPDVDSYMTSYRQWQHRKVQGDPASQGSSQSVKEAKRQLEEKRKSLLSVALSYEDWLEHTEERKKLMQTILRADMEQLSTLEQHVLRTRAPRQISFRQWREKVDQKEAENRHKRQRMRRQAELRHHGLSDVGGFGGGGGGGGGEVTRSSAAIAHEEWVRRKKEEALRSRGRDKAAGGSNPHSHPRGPAAVSEDEKQAAWEAWLEKKHRREVEHLQRQLGQERQALPASVAPRKTPTITQC